MNYQRIYDALILKAKNRQLVDVYTERHHIVPRCLGGDDFPANLVEITPEEHYVCHQLLVKIYPDNRKLVYAANMMTINSPSTPRNNKEFGWLKRRRSEIVSKQMTGSGNPMYGKTHSLEALAKISSANLGKIQPRDAIEKTRAANIGRKNSIESKEIQSKAALDRWKNNMTMYTCVHCGLSSRVKTNIVRHHNDNCKSKP